MQFDAWHLLAGLGFFLLGMSLLEQGLEGLGSHRIRQFLANNTRTPLRGVVTGTLATAFLQSSSMVGLVTLAFVGASLLPLSNALGIIIGANLGTTFTGWLVTTLGFKLSLGEYTLPWLGMGAIGMVLLKQTEWGYFCRIVLGLGLLLFGLDFMKSAMEFLRDVVDIEIFKDYPLLIYVLGGLVFTALIQSSSATMIIVLSAMSAGILPLVTAAAVIVGADLGTTSTVLLGGIGGSPDRKRVALSHLCFNLVTDIVALLLIVPLLYLITELIGISDPMYALVMFHSSFNLLGIVIFLPVIKPFTAFLNRRFSDQDTGGTSFIQNVSPQIVEAAVSAMAQDAERLIHKVIVINLRCMKLNVEKAVQGYKSGDWFEQTSEQKLTFDTLYADIRKTENLLIRFAHQVYASNPELPARAQIDALLYVCREAVYSAKGLKDIRGNLVDAHQQADSRELIEQWKVSTLHYFQHLQQLLEKTDSVLVNEKASELRASIEASHSELHQATTRYILETGSDTESLSILNINRELYVSKLALLNAVEKFLSVRPLMPTMV